MGILSITYQFAPGREAVRVQFDTGLLAAQGHKSSLRLWRMSIADARTDQAEEDVESTSGRPPKRILLARGRHIAHSKRIGVLR